MKTKITACAVLLLGGLLLGAGAEQIGDPDLVKNPAAFLASPQAGDLEVYGVKLGDAVEKIPLTAGANRRPADRPQDTLYVGPNVTYFAHEGRIYQIRVYGEIIKAMPPYNATRLQMKLGQADDVSPPEDGVTYLTYFHRRLGFTFVGSKNISAVDLYSP